MVENLTLFATEGESSQWEWWFIFLIVLFLFVYENIVDSSGKLIQQGYVEWTFPLAIISQLTDSTLVNILFDLSLNVYI